MTRTSTDILDDRLLRSGEVASIFGVDPKTVNRWARTEHLPSIRTPGGQRRYRTSDVRALLEAAINPPGASVADEDEAEVDHVG